LNYKRIFGEMEERKTKRSDYIENHGDCPFVLNQPHVKCELTLDDYKNGVDSVLDKGIEEIRKMMSV